MLYDYDPPGVDAVFPSPNSIVDTLTPTLWADYIDPTNTGTRLFRFKICNGTPAAPVGCHESSDWSDSASFVVEPGWLDGWGKESWWQVNVHNGLSESGWLGPFWFRPVVAQPPVTAHLAGAPETQPGEMPGVNPQVGNYATAATDARVAVAGPTLSVTRTYNSQDLRANGAFGPGWSTPWDQRLDRDNDSSGNVVVTLHTGMQVRFGRNADGTFSPPHGMNLTLVAAGSPLQWTLRDASGYRRVFDDPGGRLVSVTDSDGRVQTFGYNASGQLTTVTDSASGRALHVTWSVAGRSARRVRARARHRRVLPGADGLHLADAGVLAAMPQWMRQFKITGAIGRPCGHHDAIDCNSNDPDFMMHMAIAHRNGEQLMIKQINDTAPEFLMGYCANAAGGAYQMGSVSGCVTYDSQGVGAMGTLASAEGAAAGFGAGGSVVVSNGGLETQKEYFDVCEFSFGPLNFTYAHSGDICTASLGLSPPGKNLAGYACGTSYTYTVNR